MIKRLKDDPWWDEGQEPKDEPMDLLTWLLFAAVAVPLMIAGAILLGVN